MSYTKEALQMAVEMCVKDNATISQAHRVHGIPYNSLKRRVTGLVTSESRQGSGPALTGTEEKKLLDYILEMGDKGFCVTANDIRHRAYEIADASGRKNLFSEKAKAASWHWWGDFKARHSLTLRRPESLANYRASNNNRAVFNKFFDKIKTLYTMCDLAVDDLDPSCIWNMDETGISIVVSGGRVVAKVGAKQVYSRTYADRGETHTLVCGVSASGSASKPMIIFKGVRIDPDLKDHPERHGFPNCIVGTSKSGWINSDLFYTWLTEFINGLHTKRPVFLFFDGHGSHVSVEATYLAKRNNIHLLCFPSHTTNVIQPCDRSVFKSLKSHWREKVRKHMAETHCTVPNRSTFLSRVHSPYMASIAPQNVANGFRRCGLYPFNPNAIQDSDLLTSAASEKEASDPDTTVADDAASNTNSDGGDDAAATVDLDELLEVIAGPSKDPASMETSGRQDAQENKETDRTLDPGTSKVVDRISAEAYSTNAASSGADKSSYIDSLLIVPHIERKATKRKRMTPSGVCLTMDVDDRDVEWRQYNENRKKAPCKPVAKRALCKPATKKTQHKPVTKKTPHKPVAKKTPHMPVAKKPPYKPVAKKRKTGPKQQKKHTSAEEVNAPTGKREQSMKGSKKPAIGKCVCPTCGVEYSDTQDSLGDWIRCLQCQVWYHMMCEGVDEEEAPRFICSDCFS